MNYLELILKNPFRNRTRSALSITGIAIGITVIVALGLITGGLEDSVQTSLNSAGAEITVNGAINNQTMENLNLNNSMVKELAKNTGVNESAGILSYTKNLKNNQLINMDSIGSDSSMTDGSSQEEININGINNNYLNLTGIKNVNGSLYTNGQHEVIVGKSLAKTEKLTIGDKMNIGGENFTVTGIYQTGHMISDNGAYTSLSALQNVTHDKHVSEILIKTNKGVNDTQLSNSLNKKYHGNITTITKEEQSEVLNHITSLLNTATLAISLLSIFIGAIGIINTMIMAVYERTKEIGILKAVGWTSKRILIMILGETLVLTMISAVIGIIVGISISELGMHLMGNSIGTTTFSLAYHPSTFILAFGVAIIVGILGGLYPAYKASKLEPTEALKYE